MKYHFDEKRLQFKDVFDRMPTGQINLLYVQPGAVDCWHRHNKKDEYSVVVQGSLQIGMCNGPNMDTEEDGNMLVWGKRKDLWDEWKKAQPYLLQFYEKEVTSGASYRVQNLYEKWPIDITKVEWHIISEFNLIEGPIFVPRGLWHGAHNYTSDIAILLYFSTEKADFRNPDTDECGVEMMGWRIP